MRYNIYNKGVTTVDDSKLALGVDEEDIIEGERESVDELIIRLACQLKGVGKATAGAVAADFEGDIKSFLGTDKERLMAVKNSRGLQLLSDEQSNHLLKIVSEFPKDKTIAEAWVFFLGRNFLLSQVKMVDALSLSGFDINPLLAKALNLDSPRKVVAFNVYQTVTRSVVTSWGDTVEEMARFVGCKKNDYTIEGKTGTNFDLMKHLDGTDYYIQVKSGPNTMNVGMVTSLNEAIQKIEEVKPTARGILGMTYGTRARISNQIMANLFEADERMKIGREFWDFISEKSDFHKTLFKLLDASSNGILENSFIELIENKITTLEKQLIDETGSGSVNEILERYL
jgi:hypothetical protein